MRQVVQTSAMSSNLENFSIHTPKKSSISQKFQIKLPSTNPLRLGHCRGVILQTAVRLLLPTTFAEGNLNKWKACSRVGPLPPFARGKREFSRFPRTLPLSMFPPILERKRREIYSSSLFAASLLKGDYHLAAYRKAGRH